LILKLLAENRFPAIWLPNQQLLDLRALLLHRHQWVRMRTRIQNTLQAMALANGSRRGPSLWSYDGQAKIAFLPLLPHAAYSSGGHQRLGGVTKQGSPLLRFLWGEAGAHAARRAPELKRFYRRKLVHKGLGKARVAVARKLGIRLWIMLRDEIDYQEFCRRGQMQQKTVRPVAGMPETGNGAKSHRQGDEATRLPESQGDRIFHHGPQ
jgi:Transposase IS116/IS110/IS902 family